MVDHQELARALRRLVYTDKLLTIEQAHRYCDLAGIPRELVDRNNYARAQAESTGRSGNRRL